MGRNADPHLCICQRVPKARAPGFLVPGALEECLYDLFFQVPPGLCSVSIPQSHPNTMNRSSARPAVAIATSIMWCNLFMSALYFIGTIP